MSGNVWRWVLGLTYILAVATIWIASSFVVQSVVDAGVSPFLITFICNSLFVVYLPIFEISRYLEDSYGSSILFWRSKRSHLLELPESEKEALLGQDVVISDASEVSRVVVREDANGLDEKGRWTRMRVAKVSLLICPFWFLAQLTFNLSLKYTTVTVSTLRTHSCVFLFCSFFFSGNSETTLMLDLRFFFFRIMVILFQFYIIFGCCLFRLVNFKIIPFSFIFIK